MVNRKGILFLIVGILILSACSKSELEEVNTLEELTREINTKEKNLDLTENKETLISPPDLNSEEGIREYLQGQWISNLPHMSDVFVDMNIYENLDLDIRFYDYTTNESKGDYKGKIILDRIHAKLEEAPDVITIELSDKTYSMGQFFFLHRTIYEGNRVMSLFFTGDGKSVFNILLDYDTDYIIEEVMFEKVTGEILEGETRKNDSFHAVFWEHGIYYESIWLNQVDWTPVEEDNFVRLYPRPMTRYEDNIRQSILYNINPEKDSEILGDDLFKGHVYYVETDENGHIVKLMPAEYKLYLEESLYSIIEEIVEVGEYLDAGMSILFTGESRIINGVECYDVVLGTNHANRFVQEIHYSVNIDDREVYRYDVLNDIWETVGFG